MHCESIVQSTTCNSILAYPAGIGVQPRLALAFTVYEYVTLSDCSGQVFDNCMCIHVCTSLKMYKLIDSTFLFH